jgi:zinc transport system substrate-binding protein
VQTRIILIVVAALLLAGCGAKPARVGAGSKLVVAAFYPLAFAAEEIGGPAVMVENLTPAGAEPHDLELTPGEVRDVQQAALVLYLGHGFQPALAKAVEGRTGPSVDLLQDQELLAGGDPHVWLDPSRYAELALRIGAALDRPGAAAKFAARLRALDREYHRQLAGCARHEIITSHAAFGYLAARYGLRQIALEGLTPEIEPNPRAVAALVDRVRRSRATTVFFEPLISPKLAQTIAHAAGVGVASLDPLEGLTAAATSHGADYFTVMRANLRILRTVLGCR